MTQKSRHLLDVTLALLLYKQSPCFTSGLSQQNQHDQTVERGHVYMFQNTVACWPAAVSKLLDILLGR